MANLGGFLAIPYLLSVFTVRSELKKWRLSQLEVRDNFIAHVSDEAHVIDELETKKADKETKRLTLQPYIIAVGPTLAQVTSYIVVIDNCRYSFENVMEAVDMCFKAVWMMNAAYASEAKFVWTFIQKALYGLNSACDENSTSITALISDISDP